MKSKKPARRTVNYRSENKPSTLQKQDRIAMLLSMIGEGLTVAEIGKAIGCSRQLALYHVKKMAAQAKLVMVLEPCEGNGGLQFRVWDQMMLAAHYTTFMMQTPPMERAAAFGVRRAA
jgi:hypothetical protein